MMDNFMIGVILLLGSSFLARMINNKANKILDQDEKLLLMDLFSDSKIYTFGILIAIVALYFFGLKSALATPVILASLYIIALITFFISTNYNSYKKLKNNNFPQGYIKSYLISTSIRFTGLIIFFMLVYPWKVLSQLRYRVLVNRKFTRRAFIETM